MSLPGGIESGKFNCISAEFVDVIIKHFPEDLKTPAYEPSLEVCIYTSTLALCKSPSAHYPKLPFEDHWRFKNFILRLEATCDALLGLSAVNVFQKHMPELTIDSIRQTFASLYPEVPIAILEKMFQIIRIQKYDTHLTQFMMSICNLIVANVQPAATAVMVKSLTAEWSINFLQAVKRMNDGSGRCKVFCRRSRVAFVPLILERVRASRNITTDDFSVMIEQVEERVVIEEIEHLFKKTISDIFSEKSCSDKIKVQLGQNFLKAALTLRDERSITATQICAMRHTLFPEMQRCISSESKASEMTARHATAIIERVMK